MRSFGVPLLVCLLIGCGSVWQPPEFYGTSSGPAGDGPVVYAAFARQDSALAETLQRMVRDGDWRYQSLANGEFQYIPGLRSDSQQAILGTGDFGVFTDALLGRREVVQGRYYDRWYAAERYNQALQRLLAATDEERDCFIEAVEPFGGCRWGPLPSTLVPRWRRPYVRLTPDSLLAVKAAVLRFLIPTDSVAVRLVSGPDTDHKALLGEWKTYATEWQRAAKDIGVTCLDDSAALGPCPQDTRYYRMWILTPHYAAPGRYAVTVHIESVSDTCGAGRETCGAWSWGAGYLVSEHGDQWEFEREVSYTADSYTSARSNRRVEPAGPGPGAP